MEKAKAAGAKQSDDTEALQVNNVIVSTLNEELCESRIYKFGRKVDSVYYEHIINHYSGFTKITDTTLSPKEEHDMYIQFREAFPTCHAVFSQIVSASSFPVELATTYDKSNPSPDVDVVNTNNDTDNHQSPDDTVFLTMTDSELFEGSDDEEQEEDVSIPTYVIPPTDSITNKL